MSAAEKMNDIEPYVFLRSSLALFQKTPDELDATQKAQVIVQAQKEHDIESLILSSPEAAKVMVSDEELTKAMTEIEQRFDNEDNFLEELTKNGLDIDSLKEALQRQCKVENIMELVASRAPTVSDVEVGIYYHMHPEKFHREERRNAKHILITINDEFAENTREKALQRIQDIAAQLRQRPEKFADLALRHSECPTALQSGDLGSVPKGRLYPELDEVLFQLREGQLSDVIETEAGFHILLCSQIHPEQTMTLQKARPQIRQLMEERARRTCQRAWLAERSSKK